MNIAVVSEISAVARNRDILDALSGRGHTIINAGMKTAEDKPELLYIHTGLITALLLNLGKVDFVVGGCGTGQGYLNAAMQYPGVFCGHTLTALDAWLFAQINGGNCLSLALNQGYGWAADVNLRFIFDHLFGVAWGDGYPPNRKEPQQAARKTLMDISGKTHKPFAEIIRCLPRDVVKTSLSFPGVWEILEVDSIPNEELRGSLKEAAALN